MTPAQHPAVWAWAFGAIVLGALVSLRWAVPWFWRAWRELGPQDDPATEAPATPEGRHDWWMDGAPASALPAFMAALPAEAPAGLVPSHAPAAPARGPSGIAAYASALSAARAQHEAAQKREREEAEAWQAQLRAEAAATSPWEDREPLARAMRLTDETIARGLRVTDLMAAVEEYGRQLEEQGASQ